MTSITQSIRLETQKQVLINIQNWLNTTKKLDSLLSLFSSNSAFVLNLQTSILTSSKKSGTDLHIYPAINDSGELMMYVIPDIFDNSKTQWQDYISSYYVDKITLPRQNQKTIFNQAEIPETEAISRIISWQDRYQIWLNQAVIKNTLPEAFILPSADIQSGVKNTVYFALKNLTDSLSYSIDLIVDNPMNNNQAIEAKTEAFYDTCRPVPPFKPSDTKKLYVLSLTKT